MDREPSQGTDGNESGHDWSKHPKHAAGECHRDRVTGEHGGRTEDGQVGYVGRHVDEGDEGERYVDGPSRGCFFFKSQIWEQIYLGRLTYGSVSSSVMKLR